MRFKAELLATPEDDLTEAAQEAKKRKKELQTQQETAAMEDELHTRPPAGRTRDPEPGRCEVASPCRSPAVSVLSQTKT